MRRKHTAQKVNFVFLKGRQRCMGKQGNYNIRDTEKNKIGYS